MTLKQRFPGARRFRKVVIGVGWLVETRWFNGACVCSRVRLVERGSPHSLPLMESGKVRTTPRSLIITDNGTNRAELMELFLGSSSSPCDS